VQYYTYILQSVSSGKLYIGQTNNLSRRIALHNSNQVLSTKHKGPWELIFYKEFAERSETVRLETMLKRWKNKERIFSWVSKQAEKSVIIPG